MNIELTTCCPLHCPQCYCTLEGGKHISLDTAREKIDEAAEHGVFVLHLSGGETLCYPWLYDLIEHARGKIKNIHVAVSGWMFSTKVFQKLVNAGVSGIFVSLNGSTPEMNRVTRDGYDYAIHALQIMKDNSYDSSYINWVMHSGNCEDFKNILKLAEDYHVRHVMVLMFKPDASHALPSYPSGNQIRALGDKIRRYKGPVQIQVESCFSQLLAYVRDTKLFGNLNRGPMKGCRAGLYNYSITVEGKYAPCRHLDIAEDAESVDDYLAHSSIVDQIRNAELQKQAPCDACRYADYCRPCMAVPYKLYGHIQIGHPMCELWKQ